MAKARQVPTPLTSEEYDATSTIALLELFSDRAPDAQQQNGGARADTLIGSFAHDILIGGGGADLLTGGGGADLLIGGAGADRLLGGSGTDALLGGAGQDLLNGGDGADLIYGGAGADTLIGGAGADTFVFRTNDPGADAVLDFTAQDHVFVAFDPGQLAQLGLAEGAIRAAQFGLGTAATTAEQRFVFDAPTGALLFDADGSGKGAAVLLGHFYGAEGASAGLSAADISVGTTLPTADFLF